MTCEYCGHEHAPDPFYCIARLGESFLRESVRMDKLLADNQRLKEGMEVLSDEIKGLHHVIDSLDALKTKTDLLFRENAAVNPPEVIEGEVIPPAPCEYPEFEKKLATKEQGQRIQIMII